MKKCVIASLLLMSTGAMVTSSAVALDPISHARGLLVSGSTAGRASLLSVALEQCSGGNISVYTSGDDVFTDSLTAVLCSGASGALSVQHSANGSGAGTVALIEGTALPFFDWGKMALAGAPFGCAASSDTTVLGLTATVHTGCGAGAQTPTAPLAVLSDLETRKFNVISSTVAQNSAALEDHSTTQRVYGLAVTEKLYKILQAIQFPNSGHQCNPNNALYSSTKPETDPTTGLDATYTYGESPACRPNLGSSQVRSMLVELGERAGWEGIPIGIGHFYGFQDNEADTLGLGYQDTTGDAPVDVSCDSAVALGGHNAGAVNESGGSSNSVVYVCAGSLSTGLGALAEINYLRQRCQTPSDVICNENGGSNDGASTSLKTLSDYQADANFRSERCHFSNSVTGIEGCMVAHDTAGTCAIAPMPVHKRQSGYRFVKVDGGHPSIVEAYKGRTENVYTSVISRIKDSASGVAGVKTNAQQRALFNALVTTYNTNPAAIARANNIEKLTLHGYQGGELVLPSDTLGVFPVFNSPADDLPRDVILNPISTSTRPGSGSGPNNCLPTVKSYRQPIK